MSEGAQTKPQDMNLPLEGGESGKPRPGIPVARRTLDAVVRVWFRTPGGKPQLETMDVHLRGSGAGDQEYFERQLREILAPGCRVVRYELIG
jgi:hypothetical protein